MGSIGLKRGMYVNSRSRALLSQEYYFQDAFGFVCASTPANNDGGYGPCGGGVAGVEVLEG